MSPPCTVLWPNARFLATLLLILAGPLWALNPKLALTQYAHDVWTRHDGLPTSGILCLAQTKDGYIWLGTSAGLVRFDGANFTSIATDDNDDNSREPIVALYATPDNGLWIGTQSNGLRIYKNGKMRRVAMGSADPSILALAIDKQGRYFFGTTTNVYELLPDGSNRFYATQGSYSTGLMLDAQDRLWLGNHGNLERLEGDRWLPEYSQEGFTVACMYPDSRGAIWVGTADQLFHYAHKRVSAYDKSIGLLSANILSLKEDSNGDLWVGTTAGLHRFRGGKAQPIQNWDRMPFKRVACIMEDYEGSLWVGTDEGLHRFKDVKLVPWTKEEGLIGNFTPSVNATQDGSVYVLHGGDPHGITQIKDGKLTCFDNLIDGPNWVDKEGALWVATTGYITKLSRGKTTVYGAKEAVPPVWVSSMVEDTQGFIITPINSVGVHRWSPGKLEPYHLGDGSVFEVPFHVMCSMLAPDGAILMGTYDGLWKFSEGKAVRYTSQVGADSMDEWYRSHPQSKTHFKTVIVPGMKEHWISSVAVDKQGTYWLGSQRGGLTRFAGEKAFTYTTKEGLFSNQIYSIQCDDNDNLWMSSPRGILRVSIAELQAVAEGRKNELQCEVFTSEDGMKTDEAMWRYQPASAKAADGTLWFATKHGVVSVNPAAIKRNTTPPPVVLEKLVVDGRSMKSDTGPNIIPAGSEKVDFYFTALSLLVPERVHFKYRLEGYDENWVEIEALRNAHYTRLPPGNYRFRVIACNNDGVWNYEGATAEIKVLPLFHQTFWFYGLCLAVVGALSLAVHRLRVRQLRLKERELQKRVDERTAELSCANANLKQAMSDRIKAEQEVDRVHKQLLTASHQAGMAEIAAGVLHNIGNVLNSVNVSGTVLMAALRNSKLPNLLKLASLLKEKENDLPRFLTEDERGKKVAPYMHDLAKHLTQEQAKVLDELNSLQNNVDHIKDIVAMQQTYATVSGVVDTISPVELIEDALRMHQRSLERHNVKLIREFEAKMPPVEIEKHKVLQILVNLIQNGKQACDLQAQGDPTLRITLRQVEGMAEICIVDNGVGIPPENMQRIFNHGFTTKKDGHGFGLHSSALAAKSFGGSLEASSQGPGKGATFTLKIPLMIANNPPKEA